MTVDRLAQHLQTESYYITAQALGVPGSAARAILDEELVRYAETSEHWSQPLDRARSRLHATCMTCGDELTVDHRCDPTGFAEPLGVLGITDPDDEPTHRHRERQLLAQHRRSHRRTNRW